MQKENSLIFLHIPKTAGSTFHVILNARFNKNSIENVFGARYGDPEIQSFINRDMEEKKHIDLFKGHMPFGLHRYMPRKCQYIAFARDPVERVISQYYYIKKNEYNPLHKEVHIGGMSIKEFVSSGISVGMNNGQCRFLNGDIDQYKFNECTEELLNNVKSNIENHFLWLGVTERFDESLLLLSKKLSWDKLPYYFRQNISKTRKSQREISDDDIEVIKKYNRLDIKLYEYINSLIDNEISCIADFQHELNRFKVKNNKIQSRWGWLPDNLKKYIV